MADYTVKRLEEFEAVFGGGFRRVRAGLGVTSFGLAVMDFPPNFEHYPVHTQQHDSQEEVYTVLSGRATLEIGDESIELEPGVWVRVGPSETRRLSTGAESASVARDRRRAGQRLRARPTSPRRARPIRSGTRTSAPSRSPEQVLGGRPLQARGSRPVGGDDQSAEPTDDDGR